MSILSRTTRSPRGKEEGVLRYVGFTTEGPSAGVEKSAAIGAFDTIWVRYNLVLQHPSDWHNYGRWALPPP